MGDIGHVVHIQRLQGHGVVVWLDGVRIRKLVGWSLVEELRPPSTVTLTIKTDAIVWGPPGGASSEVPLEHYCDPGRGARKTPSGKNACEVCGEAWPCSAELKRRSP